MKKTLVLLLTLLMCISLVACNFNSSNTPQDTTPTEQSVEEIYNELTKYASEGKYLEGWRIVQFRQDVLEYKDAKAYYDYCEAMRAYNAGAIGEAYNMLKPISQILDAQKTLDDIKKLIGHLDGHYIEDNGRGSYLHLVINEGKVATGSVGYYDEDQSFKYTEDDFRYSIVTSEYSNGTKFIALGRYSAIGAKIEINYVMTIEEGSNEIMLIAYETEEYKTFNGLYEPLKSHSQENSSAGTPTPEPPTQTPPTE